MFHIACICTQVEFVLSESDYTLAMWPHKFKAVYSVRGGSCSHIVLLIVRARTHTHTHTYPRPCTR